MLNENGHRFVVHYTANGYPFEHHWSSRYGYTDWTEPVEQSLQHAEEAYGGNIEFVSVEEYEQDEV